MKQIISVIVPIYKVESYLKKCVDSIINQTMTDLEIILVDDGSPDNCGKICDAYAEQDARIRVIHKENGGVSSARNAGLDICTGDYIGFVDGDDYIAPDMYKILREKITANKASIAIGAVVDVYNDLVTASKSVSNEIIFNTKEEYIEEAFCGKNVRMFVWNKLYERKLFENARFRDKRTMEDVFIFLDILHCKKIGCMVFTSKAKYYYVHHEGSITTDGFSSKFFDEIDAYKYNLWLVNSHYPTIAKAGEYRVLWSYRKVLDRIILCSDWHKHRQEINILRGYIKNNLLKVIRSKHFSNKQKLACCIIVINVPLYAYCKVKLASRG